MVSFTASAFILNNLAWRALHIRAKSSTILPRNATAAQLRRQSQGASLASEKVRAPVPCPLAFLGAVEGAPPDGDFASDPARIRRR